MKKLPTLLTLVIAITLLSGCGTLKKFTGQRDDTVLPGEREDVLPPEQTRNKAPGKSTDVSAADCDPTIDVNCQTAVDQEASGSEPQ